ncbi:hypothetical protein Q3C01_00535 [Bradyrhizobium sp. UFLA05-109]
MLVVILTCWAGVQAATPTQAPRVQIDRNGVLILVRTALIALDQANKTGNYTVLRELGAPGFRVNSAEQLSQIFARQRAEHLDLSGVVAIDPQLSLLPQIEANGLMRLAGFFPSVPSQIFFDLIYAPVEGQWRLFGISVSIGSAVPAAPMPAPVNQPPSASAKPPPLAANQKAQPVPAARPQ